MSDKTEFKILKGFVVSGGQVMIDLHPQEALELGTYLCEIGNNGDAAQVEVRPNGPSIVISHEDVKKLF